jgi:hypothetical protein
MPQVTLMSDDVRTVEVVFDRGRALIDPDRLPDALGWQLKSEGLCRDDTCVAVRDAAALFVGGQLDLGGVAAALGRPAVIDTEAAIVAIGLPPEQRHQALGELRAPSFTLPDLDGVSHSLEEWRGNKKLLVAFASW